MNKILCLMICLAFFAACASAPPRVETNARNVETKANKAEANTAINQAIAATGNQPNVSTVPDPNDENRVRGFEISKDNDFRNPKGKKGASRDDKPIADNIKPNAVAAPDNSQLVSSMNAEGQPTETRTFKNHPVLAKVERVNLNDADIKIYLKNGKTVNLPETAAANFLTASAADLLEAAGVK